MSGVSPRHPQHPRESGSDARRGAPIDAIEILDWDQEHSIILQAVIERTGRGSLARARV
jgi:hypothetical protein